MTPSDDAWCPSTTFASAVAGGVVRERRAADEPVFADWTDGDVTACAGDGDGLTIGEPLPKLNGLAVDVTADGDGDGALPLPLPVLPPAAGLPLELGLVARAGLAPLLLPVLPPAAGLPLKLGLVADGRTVPCRFARCASRLALVRGALRLLCRPVRPP